MRNNLPCNYFGTFFLKHWTFSQYARVNVLLLWAQNKTEFLQKGLLRCARDLSDQWRCYGSGMSSLRHPLEHRVPPRMIYRLCSCCRGCFRLAELAAALRGWPGCPWHRRLSLWSVTGVNENIVKLLAECPLAPGTTSTENSAMPSSCAALLTRRLVMGESVSISSILQKWQLSDEELG